MTSSVDTPTQLWQCYKYDLTIIERKLFGGTCVNTGCIPTITIVASARTVSMGDEVLEADKIFINVGARAFIPPMPGLDRVVYLTNSSMMQVDYLPEHLIIIGGSYIGLEFGQIKL